VNNPIGPFLNRTGQSEYRLSKLLEVPRSTLNGWRKNGPRYRKLTELALETLEREHTKEELVFQGLAFTWNGEYYIGCGGDEFTKAFMLEAINNMDSDAYAALNNIAAQFMATEKRKG